MVNPIRTQTLVPTKPHKTIEQFAAEQDVKPFNFEEAWKAAEGIWPENESIDDFIAWLCQERRGGKEATNE